MQAEIQYGVSCWLQTANSFLWSSLQSPHLLQPPGPAALPILLHAVREDAHRRGGDQHLWTGISPASSSEITYHRLALLGDAGREGLLGSW